MDIREKITSSIISLIESGIEKGRQSLWDWAGSMGRPINFHTRTPYTGVNSLLLWLTALDCGYDTNQWLTYNQAQQMGAQVKAGSKGVLCVFWQPREYTAQENENESADESPQRGRGLLSRPFWLFNVADIDGLPEESTGWQSRPEIEVIADAERIIAASGADYVANGRGAFYRSTVDRIHMPDRRRFHKASGYYSVFMHELGHWTGHEKRLNRPHCGKFGTPAYAMEELVAELIAGFVMGHIGLESETLEEHAHYLQSWLEVLQNDKDAIFKASREASKGYQYLIERAGLNGTNSNASH